MSIGWDDHLDREWDEHCKAQDAYERTQRIQEIDDDIRRLEFAMDEAEEDGRIQDVAAFQVEIDNLLAEQEELMLPQDEGEDY